MNTAVIKVSLDMLAGAIFQGAVTIKSANVDSSDLEAGLISLLIEGDQLPALPAPGMKYAVVVASFTVTSDPETLVPKETISVSFQKVGP